MAACNKFLESVPFTVCKKTSQFSAQYKLHVTVCARSYVETIVCILVLRSDLVSRIQQRHTKKRNSTVCHSNS
ncbi:hypothetical protein L596_023892 [Steinernema carpocapsae]|uniref:Uncharacterized protein n=1 Tax=Steinernema carpocapsae TaxID=34508 RepID=A0A4U5MF21_STECR|nr:hypothetical protein L596_023892 [Steinernema carpocapsae]